jgi:hypothetical protein
VHRLIATGLWLEIKTITGGRRIGRPPVVNAGKIAYAAHLRDTGHSIADIVAKTGIARTSLYRHLPPRPTEHLTAATGTSTQSASANMNR